MVEAKKHLESDSIETLKGASDKLQAASHKVAGEMYQQPGGEQEQGAQADGSQQTQDEPNKAKKDDDDVVDADFKEV